MERNMVAEHAITVQAVVLMSERTSQDQKKHSGFWEMLKCEK